MEMRGEEKLRCCRKSYVTYIGQSDLPGNSPWGPVDISQTNRQLEALSFLNDFTSPRSVVEYQSQALHTGGLSCFA